MALGSNYLWFGLLAISACFFSGTVGREAIVGGSRYTHHKLGYQVLVQVDQVNDCGGGILDELHILTAAHCLIDRRGHLFDTPISVMSADYAIDEGYFISAEEVRVPTGYKSQKGHDLADYAVLKLARHMELAHFRYFKTLHLAHDKDNYAGEKAWIAGFGASREPGRTVSFDEVEVLKNDECQELYNNSKEKIRITIEKSQICAKMKQNEYGTRGVCTGDSGGPLVLHDGTVIGILSLITPKCDETYLPAIYTRVSSYRQHIDDYLRGNGGVKHTAFRHTQSQAEIVIQGKVGRSCIGGILDDRSVLTAGRCVISRHGVVIDEFINVTISHRNGPIDTAQVKEIVARPYYEPYENNTKADIVVLRTSRPLKFDKAEELKLPLDTSDDYDDITAWAGVLDLASNSYPYVEATVLSNYACQKAYNNSAIKRSIYANDLCAKIKKFVGRPTVFTARDVGGPLVLRDGTVIGVLSQPPLALNQHHLPALYTRVTKYSRNIAHYLRGKERVVYRQLQSGHWTLVYKDNNETVPDLKTTTPRSSFSFSNW